MTDVFGAAKGGDLVGIGSFFDRGINVNSRDNFYGKTPLIYACSFGHENIVRFLIQKGVDVNLAELAGFTPLFWAAAKGHINIVRLLLDNGANANIIGSSASPLMVASSRGYIHIVRLLIEYGANVNFTDKNNETSLLAAAASGKRTICELLIQHGAKIDERYQGLKRFMC